MKRRCEPTTNVSVVGSLLGTGPPSRRNQIAGSKMQPLDASPCCTSGHGLKTGTGCFVGVAVGAGAHQQLLHFPARPLRPLSPPVHIFPLQPPSYHALHQPSKGLSQRGCPCVCGIAQPQPLRLAMHLICRAVWQSIHGLKFDSDTS